MLGEDPLAWWERVERQADEARADDGRRLRRDSPVLLAGVASYPVPVGAMDDAEHERLNQWAQETAEWWQHKHGGGPVSVVMHLDESYPHLHMYAAPSLERGQRMADIHPGEAAKQQTKGSRQAWLAEQHALA